MTLPVRTPQSLIEQAAVLDRPALDAWLNDLDDDAALKLLYDWEFWARPNQMLPTHNSRSADGSWFCWAQIAGRGSGKTRSGAEAIKQWVGDVDAPAIRVALIAETAADARDVIVEGESGILAVSPPWNKPLYTPSKRLLEWKNGSKAILFSGEEPDQLRGPQFHKAWVDELAKMRRAQETWDNLEFGLRLGDNPQVIVTTTPRPIPIIKLLLEDPKVIITRASTYENISHLAASYIDRVITRYEGTRVGRQELHAEVLMDMPGALWTYDMIEAARIRRIPPMVRIVVAIDPAVTAHEESDETGIVVCGKDAEGIGYVLRDVSGRYTGDQWAAKAIQMYHEYGADRIIAEVNNGGDLVESILRVKDHSIPYRAVTASKGKVRRAEPVAALYERGLVKHHGQFAALEDQMCTYAPDDIPTSLERKRSKQVSPDRMDALVWGMTDLMLKRHGAFVV